jgi:hypothetical protein
VTSSRNERLTDARWPADEPEPGSFSPDGYDPASATIVIREVAQQLRTQPPPVPTAWMSMSERERAEIRPPRRRTPRGTLRLVRGGAPEVGLPVADEGEAA